MYRFKCKECSKDYIHQHHLNFSMWPRKTCQNFLPCIIASVAFSLFFSFWSSTSISSTISCISRISFGVRVKDVGRKLRSPPLNDPGGEYCGKTSS